MAQRPYKPKPGRQIILIQCEGKRTEYIYLDDFCAHCGLRHDAAIDVNPGKGQNAVVTVETALAKKKTEGTRGKHYDEAWCVLDVEHAGHAHTLTEAVALAAKHNVKLVLSNPSFEVWLLCHFGHVTKWLENGDAAGAYLTATYWKKHFDCDYDKADDRLYTRLAERVPIAVADARWLMGDLHAGRPCRDANPSTEVYTLIEHLLPLPRPNPGTSEQ